NQKTAYIWDVKSHALVHTLNHDEKVDAVAFHPDGKRLATADGQGTIKLWDFATGRQLRTYRGHSSNFTGMVFSPDGRFLVTANWDGTSRIWDATMTAREWHGPEARKLVEARFETLLVRSDILKNLQDDTSLSDEVRSVALEIAQEWDEDPNTIDQFAS